MKQQPNPQHERSGPKPTTMDVRWPQPGIAVLTLGGEHDLESADRLNGVLTQTLGVCTHLVVDLTTTEFIDSTTIHALISTKKRADATDRRFTLLLGTKPIVERALEITGMLTTLNRVHTLEKALGEPVADR